MPEELVISRKSPVPCLAAVVDIRGFTAFSEDEDDQSAVADYISFTTKYVLSTIDQSGQFEKCWFKLLGDGLLLVLPMPGYNQAKMINVAKPVIKELVDLSERFPVRLAQDPPPGLKSAPSSLAVGISYGPLIPFSIRWEPLASKRDDYLGRPINLAARLQEIARRGGCIAHESVYEVLFRHDPDADVLFKTLFKKHREVTVPGIGETTVWATADLPDEFLKSKREEELLETFAKRSLAELRRTYARKRSAESPFVQLPETTRFVLFRKEGEAYRETLPYMIDQKISFHTEVSFKMANLKEGVLPVPEAILRRRPVLTSYPCRFDHNPDEYWRLTKEAFPHAPLDALREMTFHPSSILVVPVLDSRSGEAIAAASFDSLEVGIFNEAIADEMEATVPILYEQAFGAAQTAVPRSIEL